MNLWTYFLAKKESFSAHFAWGAFLGLVVSRAPVDLGGRPGLFARNGAPVSYLGNDVLTLNCNRVGPFAERLRRKFVLRDAKTGTRVSDEQPPAPAASRPFTWTALGCAEIAAMRAFVDARVGRDAKTRNVSDR